jgi:benzoate/toluate 1,2-dioxygenase alpha subunit
MASTRDFSGYIDDRSDQGIFRVDRSVYTDPAVLEAEYETIFEGNWLFLCHETMIPNPGDYFTAYMGRQPVFVVRGEDGGINGFINACGHRGAMLLTYRVGNVSTIDCPYHGFCFDRRGKCISARNQKTGWPEGFDIGSFDLTPIARLDSYRGLIFGSLSEDVDDLAHYLGAAKALIDIFVAPAPAPLEIVPGFCVYVSNCNWKVMHENGPDAYHAPVVHRNFADTIAFRESRGSYEGVNKTERGRLTARIESASYDLGNGHTAFWNERKTPEAYPIYAQKDELAKRFTPGQLDWILRRGRHMTIFPNLLLNDLASSHLRTYRPLSVDRMETTIWCIAPVGEPAEMRAARLRKFEDFFLPSGMATPDDIAICEAAQRAAFAVSARWTEMGRGSDSAFRIDGPDEAAKQLGFKPKVSSNSWDHEITLQGVYRQWLSRVNRNGGAHRG